MSRRFPKLGLWWQYLKSELPPLAVLFALSILLLTLGFLVHHAVRAADETEALYARSGARTNGKVRRTLTRLEGPRGNRTLGHYVEYEFANPGGGVRRGNSNVSEAQFKALRRGDSIVVDYLRDDPGVNRAAGPKVDSAPPAWLGFGLTGSGAFLCLLSVAGLGRHSLKAHRRAKVIRDGLPYSGWVEEIDEHPQQSGSPRYVLSFKFRDGNGDVSDGWIWLPRRLRQRWVPGAPIVVLWDGATASDPEPDIFEFRSDELKDLAGSVASDGQHRGKRRRRRKEAS